MTTAVPANLALRERRVDIVFAVVFSAFTFTSVISDLLPTIGVNFSHPSGNFFVQSNYWYVEFFGEAALRTHNPAKFLAFNLPYVLLPLLLLVRMRRPLPFTRRF